MLKTVTISGPDDTTDIPALAALCARYPFAEVGVLYGAGGPQPRFPSTWWMAQLAETGCPVSIHLCSRSHIEAALRGHWPAVLSGIEQPWAAARRAQLNFHGHPSQVLHDPVALARGLRHPLLGTTPLILQLDGRNDALCHWLASEYPTQCQHLVDRSHGAGRLPADWPAPPDPAIPTGYAGGLSPEIVALALRRLGPDAARPRQPDAAIPAIPPAAAWVDAETALMRDGRFSLARAEAFLAACAPFTSAADPAGSHEVPMP